MDAFIAKLIAGNLIPTSGGLEQRRQDLDRVIGAGSFRRADACQHFERAGEMGHAHRAIAPFFAI